MHDAVVSVMWPVVEHRKRTVLTTKKTQSKESRSNPTQFRRNVFLDFWMAGS